MYKFICQIAVLVLLALPVSADLVLDQSFNGQYISGSTAVDRSVEGNDGVIYGAVAKAGKIGQALSFDGTNDYVDCGNDASINIGTSDFSIEFWANLGTQEMPHWGSAIIGKRGGDWFSMAVGYEVVFEDNTGKIRLYFADGTNSVLIRTTTDLRNTGWRHVAFSIDRDGNGKCYIDSINEVTVDASGTQESITSGQNLKIGCRGGNSYLINGTIDEVRIWNEALSSAEILINYQRGRNVRMNPASAGKIKIDPNASGRLLITGE